MAGGDQKIDKSETKVENAVDGKEKKGGQQEFKFAAKSESKGGMEGFMLFLWNPETKEFLGRTGMSWLKIGIFYLIYYAFLAGFFMLMLLAFFAIRIDNDEPAYDTRSGIIGGNPGVGFRPMPDNKDIKSTLIWFRHGEETKANWQPWVDRLEEHMKDYKNASYTNGEDGKGYGVECGEFGEIPRGASSVCTINQDKLFQGLCNSKDKYGFRDGKPCILIKLNKIFNWEPMPYESVDQMPEDIPQSIIDEFEENDKDNATKPLNERVWIECEGENPADKEHLGHINYYPARGVGINFFPYRNQKGYLSPVIFAQLDNPEPGVMIAVECKAWAQNIKHDSMERRGLVHFELMID